MTIIIIPLGINIGVHLQASLLYTTRFPLMEERHVQRLKTNRSSLVLVPEEEVLSYTHATNEGILFTFQDVFEMVLFG